MHADEIDTDESLVRKLLETQFPQWADLPIGRVEHAGTDHAIYRLGDRMSVRLPRIEWAAGQPDKEETWLPRLAPHLPAPVPVPIAKGEPGEGFPYRWLVSPWLDGEDATRERMGDPQTALDLAAFILALQRVDSTGGPRPGKHNFLRGVPLAVRDPGIRAAIPAWEGIIDTAAITASWEEALRAPAWDGPPVWLHGDLLSGNVLVENGRLSAVIDFGCLGVGDPACDLSVAWTLLSGENRRLFREAVAADDATWARARGWALMGVGALPYYAESNPSHVARARRSINEVLDSGS
jgi:aminoglycoside phosphotransferase (APT) family kinase protein